MLIHRGQLSCYAKARHRCQKAHQPKLGVPTAVYSRLSDGLTGLVHQQLQGACVGATKEWFRPRRDVDLFLDRENKRFGKGYLQGSDVLKQLLERDSMLHGDPSRHQGQIAVLEGLLWDFRDWLGYYKYSAGLATLPPSRFSYSNANGLWEYSPLLCGAGLAEGLEIGYRFGQLLWDQIPEPMLLVHLHNMLVQKKYLNRPIGLFASLEETFRAAFFADGRPPTSNFPQALSSRVDKTGTHMAQRQRAKRRGQVTSIHAMLDVAANRFFSIKSNLLLYRESGWNIDRIPNEDLGKQTLLFNLRSDAESFGQRSADTGGPHPLRLESDNDPVPALPQLPMLEDLSRRELLETIRLDISSDVSGTFPYSSLNFPWVTARMMTIFMMVEDELKKLNNPTYNQIYLSNSGRNPEKRVFLVAALSETDEECVRTMARVMEEQRMGWMQHIYWEDLDDSLDPLRNRMMGDRNNVMAPDACNIM
ncbi:hypothetical protein ACHAPE_007848 [Trichoderma viride]